MTAELKLKLAAELPELLRVYQPHEYHPAEHCAVLDHKHHIHWLDTGKEVTEREWDWVVTECLKRAGVNKFNADQWEQLGRELENAHPAAYPTGGDYHDLTTLITDLTAEQRAEAYFKVKENI